MLMFCELVFAIKDPVQFMVYTMLQINLLKYCICSIFMCILTNYKLICVFIQLINCYKYTFPNNQHVIAIPIFDAIH